ncbi:MAG TPA: nuclear transport factor 2 family protein [Polyangia bacterium]|nr:nuclear transport factor 2 family protein [Polyangia bacterium]
MTAPASPIARETVAPSPAVAVSARELAGGFFDALNRHDVAAALAALDPAAPFEVVPAGLRGTAASVGAPFLRALMTSFPDLLVQVRALMGTDALAVAEVKLEGTQAADFLGILNQEKHLDLDQAWMVWATGGRISGVRAYWCQNQLYRRLAVKRLDRISILG